MNRAISIVMAAFVLPIVALAGLISTAADAWPHALTHTAPPPKSGNILRSLPLPHTHHGSPVRPGDRGSAPLGNIPGRPGTVPGLPEYAPGATSGGLGRVPLPSWPPTNTIGLPSEDSPKEDSR